VPLSAEPLFVPALASLDGLVPHDGLLSPDELESVAGEIAGRTDIWEPLVHSDVEHRRYELVYEDDRIVHVGHRFDGQADRTVDAHVKNLRNCLGPYRKFIVTLRGVGYKFEYEN
jgi:hypothetical protein